MNEHLLYAYALGYYHAVAKRTTSMKVPNTGLSGELRIKYTDGYLRGVKDNIFDSQANSLAPKSTSAVDYADFDCRR